LNVQSAAVMIITDTTSVKKETTIDGTATLRVTTSGVLVAEKRLQINNGATLKVEMGGEATIESGVCGGAGGSAKGNIDLAGGGKLIVQSRLNLDVKSCTIGGAGSKLYLNGIGKADGSATIEADSVSQVEAGTYAIAELETGGKATLIAAGDVVLQGQLKVSATSKVEARGAFETTGEILLAADASLKSSGSKSFKCAKATFDEMTKYSATLKTEAAASANAALTATGSVALAGELNIDTQVAVKKNDKFTIAKYTSKTGTFSTITFSGAGARKRAASDWQVEQTDTEVTAKYIGADATPPPTTTTVAGASTGAIDTATTKKSNAAVRNILSALLSVSVLLICIVY